MENIKYYALFRSQELHSTEYLNAYSGKVLPLEMYHNFKYEINQKNLYLHMYINPFLRCVSNFLGNQQELKKLWPGGNHLLLNEFHSSSTISKMVLKHFVTNYAKAKDESINGRNEP